MKQKLFTFLRICCIALFIVSVIMLARQYLDKRSGSESYDRAQQIAGQIVLPPTAVPTEAPTEAPTEVPAQVSFVDLPEAGVPLGGLPATAAPTAEPSPTPVVTPEPTPSWIPAPLETEDPYIAALQGLDLAALQEINPDVAGWIFVPDTPISYPILYGEDNDFYLTHTWEKKKNSVGSIFMEHLNAPDFTDFNTILYGHNMADGSMFAFVKRYIDEEFFLAHPYVYVALPGGVLCYTVFAAYEAPLDGAVYGLSFHQEQTRLDYLAFAEEHTAVKTGLQPATTDRFLTLSTCTGLGYDTRYVIQAYLPMIQEQE